MRIPALLTLSVLAASAGTAFAQGTIDLPTRRAGQWEIRMQAAQQPQGMPEMVVKTCIDQATDRRMMQSGMSMLQQNCEKREMRRDGSNYVIEAVCQMGPMRMTSNTTISGDFQASYSVRSSATIQMPNQANPQTTNTVQEARWVSASCTDGMVPGDILLPTGQKMNINSMPSMTPGQQPAPSR